MDPVLYLQRIGIERPIQVTFDDLFYLQEQHMLHIPFENLDVIQGRKIELHQEKLFDKIVTKRRGGFCYEVNGMFHWLLDRLGFAPTMISGRVIRPDGSFGPVFDHLALLITLENAEYLMDAGFGNNCRSPLPLTGEEVKDVSGNYRIRPNPEETNGYLYQKQEDEKWKTEYQFTTIPQQFSDFEEMCNFHQTSPKSIFTQKKLVTIATEDGRITFSENSFTIVKEGKKTKVPVFSQSEQVKMLKNYFGFDNLE